MKEDSEEETRPEDPARETGACPIPEAAASESELSQLRAELEKQSQAAQGLSDKYLRAHAEFENYKKRILKDQGELLKYSNEPLLREILTVLDNLSRAKAHAESSPQTAPWVEGVALTIKQFEDILSRFGVKPIVALGEPFDPAVHQAMLQMESDRPEGTILEELQRGYLFHDRVLRPALVAVAKGRPSHPTKSDTTNEE